jgi:hypothetical protein
MPTTPMILLAATLGAVIAVAPATSARGQTADPAKWVQLQKKAKEEGQLVLSGPPFPGLRTALSGAFNQRYGIELNYLGMNAGEVIARVDTESRAGKVSIDANLGGTSTCWAMSQRDEIESMGAKLIDPDILRPAVWKYGKPKLNESGLTPGLRADFNCSFQVPRPNAPALSREMHTAAASSRSREHYPNPAASFFSSPIFRKPNASAQLLRT